jgi:predicted TIM-barrel fold metal-dependent hydrolase
VYPNQIKGLTEGMRVSWNRMVFGTDYPYGIGFWDVDKNINGLLQAQGLNEEEKAGVLWRNAEGLWQGKIKTLEPES